VNPPRTSDVTRGRWRRHALSGTVLLLVLAAAHHAEGARPLGSAVVFLLVCCGLAYLTGYHIARNAGRIRKGQRNRLIAVSAVVVALLLCVLFLALAKRPALFRPFLPTTGVTLATAYMVGRALGRKQRMRRRLAAQKQALTADPRWPESALAHTYLDGLRGLEIGGSSHNPFGLKTLNVDYTASMDTVYKQSELKIVGKALPVDIVASGDALPILDESQDFVVTSHVLEHIPDPIMALEEWYRVTKPGGYVFMIIPHKERTFDRDRPRTTLEELVHRHETGDCPGIEAHCSVWVTEDVLELARHLGWQVVAVQDVDDKVGNGFTVVIQKEPRS